MATEKVVTTALRIENSITLTNKKTPKSPKINFARCKPSGKASGKPA